MTWAETCPYCKGYPGRDPDPTCPQAESHPIEARRLAAAVAAAFREGREEGYEDGYNEGFDRGWNAAGGSAAPGTASASGGLTVSWPRTS